MVRPPGPRGLESLGFVGFGNPATTLAFLQQTACRYGPVSYFRLLNKHFYLVDDSDLIHEILVTRQHEFVRDTGATLLRELVGDGLITREEPRHVERRRVMQPAFHKAQISSYAQAMIQEASRESDAWRDNEEIDAGRVMRRLTLSVVGSALFGADFRECAGEIARVLERVLRRSARIAPFFAFFEPAVSLYRRHRPDARSLFFASERAELDRIIEPVILARRKLQTADIVSLLLEARDEAGEPLTPADIRNEVVTLVLAGHETTATALTWAWWLLSQSPDVRTKVEREVDSVAGDRELAPGDIEKLAYTSLVFKEALRLYPPALAFGRRPKEPIELSGYRVPKGATVLLSPYITHRNARYFPDPEQFRPERWLDELPPKLAYFPFGAGAKMCIGDAFARMEGVLVLAAVARKWQLHYAGKGLPEITAGFVLRPNRRILMTPILRTPAHAALAN